MALEALRDVFIQAGQSYANRARQDELLAQERARQNELLAQERARQDVIYTRQRGDTEKDMDRRNNELVALEDRAVERAKASENRALVNQVRSAGAEAQRKMRSEYANITGDISVLNVNTDGSYAVKDTELADKYEKGLSDGKNKRALEEAMRQSYVAEKMYNTFQTQDDKAKARSRLAVVSDINQINEELAAVEGELSRSHADMTTRITEGRNKLATQVAEKIAGPAGSVERARYVAANKNKLKGDESDFSILYNSGSLGEVQAMQDAYVKAEGSRDPGANALLQKQSYLLKRSNDAHDFARKIEANLTPGSRGQWSAGYSDFGATPGNTSYFTSQKMEAKDGNPPATTPPPSGGVPSIEAVTGALNRVPAAAFSPVTDYPSSSNDVPNDPDPVVVGSGNSTTSPALRPVSPTDATEAVVVPTVESSGPGFFSRVGDVVSDNAGTVAAGAAAALGTPGAVKGTKDFLSTTMDKGRSIATRAGGALKASRGQANALARASLASNSAAFGGSAVLGSIPMAAGAGGAGYLTGKALNKAVPYITDAVGLSNFEESYGGRTPEVSELLADAYLAKTGDKTASTFGDEYLARQEAIRSAPISKEEKEKRLAALVSFKDEMLSRGFNFQSPTPEINAAAGIPATARDRRVAEGSAFLQGIDARRKERADAAAQAKADDYYAGSRERVQRIQSGDFGPPGVTRESGLNDRGPGMSGSRELDRIMSFFAP